MEKCDAGHVVFSNKMRRKQDLLNQMHRRPDFWLNLDE